MRRIFASLFCALLILGAGVQAHAQSAADIQAQIAALMEQLRILQSQQGTGTTTGGVVTTTSFNKNLYYGMVNDADVRALQSILKSKGYFMGDANGNYYSLTLEAVQRFQAANGIEPTGYVGPQTRAVLNAQYTSPSGINTNLPSNGSYTGNPANSLPAPVLTAQTGSCLNGQGSVVLSWNRVSTASPYQIFRDGQLINTVSSDKNTTYTDYVTSGTSHTYAVEATFTPSTPASPLSNSVFVTATSNCSNTGVTTSTGNGQASVNLKANGSDGPVTIGTNNPISFTWSFANLSTGCSLSQKDGFIFASSPSGSGNTSFTYYDTNRTGNVVFAISCDRNVVRDEVAVNIGSSVAPVTPPSPPVTPPVGLPGVPVVTLEVTPSSGVLGSFTSTLSWNSTFGAMYCTKLGPDWSGTALPNATISNIQFNTAKIYTYSLNCTNAVGTSATVTKTVTVNPQGSATPTPTPTPVSVTPAYGSVTIDQNVPGGSWSLLSTPAGYLSDCRPLTSTRTLCTVARDVSYSLASIVPPAGYSFGSISPTPLVMTSCTTCTQPNAVGMLTFVQGSNGSPLPPTPSTFSFYAPNTNIALVRGVPYDFGWTGTDTGVTQYSIYLQDSTNPNNPRLIGTANATIPVPSSGNHAQVTIPADVVPKNGVYSIRFSNGSPTSNNTTGGSRGPYSVSTNPPYTGQ